MLTIQPVLHDIWLIGIHESANVYATLRFEPFHCLSLGLSKLLKEYFFSNLSDPNQSSFIVVFSSEMPKPFSMIKEIVLGQLNHCLKDSVQQALEYSRGSIFLKESVG